MTALPKEPSRRGRPEGRSRARAPRMAEVVAGRLRDAILSGELTVVPRLEDLVEEYDVGPPAAREAMRILETGERRVVTFGYSDDEAFSVGLTCGGTVHLFLEPLDW